MPISAAEMFEQMAYDFMARFNWTIGEIDSLDFPVALALREGMIDEQKRAEKQQRDAELRARTRGR